MNKQTQRLAGVLGIALMLTACNAVTGDSTGGESASSSVSSEDLSGEQASMPNEGLEGEAQDAYESSVAAMENGGTSASLGIEADVGADMVGPRVIEVTVEDFKFAPTSITVKKGEKVVIRMTGLSGRHGFAVPDLGINTEIPEGKTVDIDIPTDTAETFAFKCSIPCGPGHRDMTGTITITE
jgi:heme/copper-type cytochrome/quinol oxidase subunit 2